MKLYRRVINALALGLVVVSCQGQDPTNVRVQNVLKKLVASNNREVVGLGSWISGKKYNDPLTGGAGGVGQEVRDHVGEEIAAPEIEDRQHKSGGAGKQQLRPAPVSKMGERECRERHHAGDETAAGEFLQAFDAVAAEEEFFDDRGAQDEQRALAV